MDVRRNDEIGQALGGKSGVGDQPDVIAAPIARQLRADAADLHIIEASHDAAAAAGKGRAAGK